MILLKSNVLLYITMFIIFPFFILHSVKIREEKPCGTILDLDTCECLKGIFMIIIIIHHYTIRMQEPGLLTGYKFAGFLGTAVFFFLSGYGLHYQLITKQQNYLKSFIIKKIFRLYSPWILCIAFFAILYRVQNVYKILKSILLFKVIFNNDYNWFLIAILFLYITYFFCYKIAYTFFKDKVLLSGIIMELIISICYVITLWYLHKGMYWINSIIMFHIGAFFSLYQKNIYKMNTSSYKMFLYAFFLFFIISIYLISNFSDNLFSYYCCNISTISMILALLLKIKLRSHLLQMIGKLSWEIFLVQSGIIIFYYKNFLGSSYSFINVFIIILATAFFINKINCSMLLLLEKRNV